MKKVISVFLAIIFILTYIPTSALSVKVYYHLLPVKDGYIAYYYGYSQAYGDDFHKGIDIHSRGDDTIYAAYSGTVGVATDPCPHDSWLYSHSVDDDCGHFNTFGNYIRINNDDGSYSFYGHLKQHSLLVSVGQRVEKGQALAIMGASGAATGKHLHYEVRNSTNSNDLINTNPVENGGQISYSYEGYGQGSGGTPDTEAPTVSNPFLSNVSGASFTVNCDLYDNVGVTSVWLNIYGPGGENGYRVYTSNGRFSHTINTADYGGAGWFTVHLYAFDAAGNETPYAFAAISAVNDTVAPTVSNGFLSNISGSSFTVNCDLYDNVGVTSVWLNIYGPGGQNGYRVYTSNGRFSHTINTADYGGAGWFTVHLYAFDDAGNETPYAFDAISAVNQTFCLDVDINLDGYIIYSGINDVSFDVIINGSTVADDWGDYCADIGSGASYIISDIKTNDCYKLTGPSSYSGTISSATTITIPVVTDHSWNSGVITKSQSCKESGIKTFTCTKCGETKTEAIPKTNNHSWNSGVVTKAPTCSATGEKTFICTVCGAERTEPIARVQHKDDNNDGLCDYGCGTQIYTTDPGQGSGDTPDQPGGSQNVCKYCGQVHPGPLGGIIAVFHNLLYFFKNLFG